MRMRKNKYFKKYASLISYTLKKYNEEIATENTDGWGIYFAILNSQLSDFTKVFLIKDFRKIKDMDDITMHYKYNYGCGGHIRNIEICNTKGKVIYIIEEE